MNNTTTSQGLDTSRDNKLSCPQPDVDIDIQRALDLDLTSYEAAHYWDASTMAPLNETSAVSRDRALTRLSTTSVPDMGPAARKSAGRGTHLIVRRPARGLAGSHHDAGGELAQLLGPNSPPRSLGRDRASLDDAKIPKPFHIEPLCQLPCSLAKTELAVRPCVAFLHADNVPGKPSLVVDESMIPQLNAKEVAAVFSGPFHNFLKQRDERRRGDGPDAEGEEEELPFPDGDWYDGRWTEWHAEPWRIHSFYVPINNQRVTKPPARDGGQAALADELEEDEVQRFLVWGLTGRMLVDAARIAYAEEPEFEHNDHYGDEAIIARLETGGMLPEKKRREVGLDAVKDDPKDAKM
ncbi:Bcpcd1 [Apiospora hydei]|uniref:Bcpcd1 n=1 Tax=Apiospora hydei TaxID=1337664 RepID=A0ABR1X081_9PEZI